MYTQTETAQIKHIIDLYRQMSHECREKYIIFGDGMIACNSAKQKEG